MGIAKFKFGSFLCERNIKIKISRMNNIFNAGNMSEYTKRCAELDRRKNITTQNEESLEAKTYITTR